MAAPPFCRFLEWDSSFFGVRIASLMAPLADQAIDPARLRAALGWCRQESIDCAYLLSDSADLVTLRAAEAQGFQLVDVRMTFERSMGTRPGRAKPREAIRSGSASRVRGSADADIPELRAIAARSHTASRFYVDGRFPRSLCDELYATWIEKSCRGWADKVFVAEHEGRPRGYVSVHLRTEDHSRWTTRSTEGAKWGEIGLVAVASEAQGLGLGRELLEHALAWFAANGATHVSVVTQGRNIAAQRLYQSNGFCSLAVELWHHAWFDRAPLRA